jgi:hypothetical protein
MAPEMLPQNAHPILQWPDSLRLARAMNNTPFRPCARIAIGLGRHHDISTAARRRKPIGYPNLLSHREKITIEASRMAVQGTQSRCYSTSTVTVAEAWMVVSFESVPVTLKV